MSNKHKLLLVLPLLTLVLAVFMHRPQQAQAAICLDMYPVPTEYNSDPQGFLKTNQFCAFRGSKPVLWNRNSATTQCLDGTDTLAAVGSLGSIDTNDTTKINAAINKWCLDNKHGPYDPIGDRRCNDGYDISSDLAHIGGLGGATKDQINAWCESNQHFGYGYTAPVASTTEPDTKSGDTCTDTSVKENLACNKIVTWLRDIVNFLSAGVIVIVIAMIIIGGIQYSYAGGDPNGVAEAKAKIYNAIFALFAYIFLYAFIQWLIPGGIF